MPTRVALTQATATNSNDLQFSQLRIPFRQEGWVITIADAALRGATLGATASGTINIPGGKIAISGAFIPAFGLNNMPGSIPLLGASSAAATRASSASPTGSSARSTSPQLTMNPISALAPGIFRKIFEYR